VTIGLGARDAWQVRNTRFEVAWAALEVGEERAMAMASTALEQLLGVWGADVEEGKMTASGDMVAYEGGRALDMGSKPVAVLSPERGLVDLI
jgi:hypothetical protein